MRLLESGESQWDPSQSIKEVLLGIVDLLYEPEISLAVNHEILREFCDFKEVYIFKAKESAKK